jgi:hypothetical protein
MTATRIALAMVVALALAGPATAMEVQVLTSDDPLNAWRTVTTPEGKTMSFTVGLGSGAFRHPADPADMIVTVSDRGPNFTCEAAKTIIGETSQPLCQDVKRARFYPTPNYSPSIYRLVLDREAGRFAVKDVISLKTASGRPVSGLVNRQKVAVNDQAIDLAGRKLPFDPNAVDAEAIVSLSDGSFWIAEEMGPSILRVAADGRIVQRFVPADAAKDYKRADTEISATLPAILSKRQSNRGIESLALSPDEAFLYFMLQSPLANPNVNTYTKAKNTRLFKMNSATGKLLGEYVYRLDDPQNFALDPSDNQSSPRVSEMTAIGMDRLMVLERTKKTTKLYETTLAGATDILGSKWDLETTKPSLEKKKNLEKSGINLVEKILRFDTARDFKDAPVKIEGMAVLGDGALALINDNDFGITGEATQVLIVKGAVNADLAAFRK